MAFDVCVVAFLKCLMSAALAASLGAIHNKYKLKYDSNKVNKVQKSAKKQKSEDASKDFTKRKYSGENIDQLRKKLKKEKDRTQENLQKLSFLSRSRVNKESTSLIFKRATRAREEPEIVNPVEGTAFTEEDFLMFEREYVVD